MVVAILPRLSGSFARLLYTDGPPGRARHSTSFIGLANGPQLTTEPFSDKRCVHTSRKDRLLCLTLIVFSLSVPKQQEVHPNSSGSTNNSRVSRLRMSFNYLTGQNRDNKCALRGTKLPSPLANSASNNRGPRSQW